MAKHAHGARSLVRVQLVGGRVLVIVEDDGEGVTTPTPGSYGLVGMRERLVFFGGRVDAGPRARQGLRRPR